MTPTDVCNLALGEVGNRVAIQSLTDGSPAANAANLFYVPKTQMLMRTAPWGMARAQITLSLWKSAFVNGSPSPTPPPQPWLYSYLYPNDCLKMRFLQPTLNTPQTSVPLMTGQSAPIWYPQPSTTVPFVDATDVDINGNPMRVILTNLPQAQGIYVRDLSGTPDLWDPMFLAADCALLAAYFINALTRDKQQMAEQASTAKNLIDTARTANANEAITTIDHTPDWIRSRRITGLLPPWGGNMGGMYGGWESCVFPDGQAF